MLAVIALGTNSSLSNDIAAMIRDNVAPGNTSFDTLRAPQLNLVVLSTLHMQICVADSCSAPSRVVDSLFES